MVVGDAEYLAFVDAAIGFVPDLKIHTGHGLEDIDVFGFDLD